MSKHIRMHACLNLSFSLSLFPLFLSPTSDNRAHTHARSTLTFSTPLCTLVFAQERPVRRKRNGFSGHITVDVTVRGHFRDERSEGAGEGGGEGGGGVRDRRGADNSGSKDGGKRSDDEHADLENRMVLENRKRERENRKETRLVPLPPTIALPPHIQRALANEKEEEELQQQQRWQQEEHQQQHRRQRAQRLRVCRKMHTWWAHCVGTLYSFCNCTTCSPTVYSHC